MKRTIAVLILSLLVAIPAMAQTVTFHLAWNQTDATPAQITSGYQYTLKIDTGTPTTVTPACVAAIPPAIGSQCTSILPTLSSGPHTLTLTAYNGFGSTPSDPLSGTAPSKPIGVSVTVTITIP